MYTDVMTTHGTLLNGRISYQQAGFGHRTGIEPILLAAAVPACRGDRVIEAGTGAGAALLCLTHRVPGVNAVGLEREACIAAIASTNISANGFNNATIVTGDILRAPFRERRFDHAMANPPWHDDRSTASTDDLRCAAHRASTALLHHWTAALAELLHPYGSLTLICSTATLSRAIVALEAAHCGAAHIMPLWPRAGRPAKIALVQARLNARGGSVLLPGLTLHDEHGYTEEAQSILRNGGVLTLRHHLARSQQKNRVTKIRDQTA